MKLNVKIISLILSVFMVAAAFAGCGNKNDFIDSVTDVETDGDVNVDRGTDKNKDKETSKSTDKNTDPNIDDVYAGGANDNATQNIVSTSNSVGGKNVVFESSSSATPLVLASSSKANYTIVSFFSSGAGYTAVNNFATSLKTKTGATFTVSTDTSSIGGKQIVIGYSSKIMPYIGEFGFKSFTGGSAAVVGETIYIASPTVSYDVLPGIFGLFIDQIKVTGGSSYRVPSDLKIAFDNCAISENLPFFTTSGTASSVTNKGTFSAGGGNYQQTYKGMHAIDVKNYNDKLVKAGYLLKQKNTINSNSFYTFVKGDTMIHINWFAKLDQYSIIYGPKTYVPESTPITNYKKLVTPSITQMALYNTGQSNVIQLEDGRFVVIDGGRAKGSSETNNHDCELLINFLNSKKPASHAKPKVIWMFTHAHSDHLNLARDNFFPTYKNQIEIEMFCFNFPDFNELDNYVMSSGWSEKANGNPSDYALTVEKLYTSINTNFPNTPIYTHQTGEILYLPGCKIEFLMAPEDFYLNKFEWVNDTSTAFKIEMKGKTFMVYGDCTERVNDQLYKTYGSYLKADIIQIAHHGVGGATLNTVKANDADICFWAVRQYVYDNDSRAKTEVHLWLKATSGTNGQRTRKHYTQDYTATVTIPSMAVSSKRWYSGDISARTYLG